MRLVFYAFFQHLLGWNQQPPTPPPPKKKTNRFFPLCFGEVDLENSFSLPPDFFFWQFLSLVKACGNIERVASTYKTKQLEVL